MSDTTNKRATMSKGKISDVHKQVMWSRLISVVEEQAATLIRIAFCPSVREAGDLSAGVFDRSGRMMAQAVTGTPGHVNTMAEAVFHFIREFEPKGIHEGDTWITNDPWKGTGHLYDLVVVSDCGGLDRTGPIAIRKIRITLWPSCASMRRISRFFPSERTISSHAL